MRKTKNKHGNTIRDILSISRHIIRSTPVSASVHATESIDWRRVGFGGPPFPCTAFCCCKNKLRKRNKTWSDHQEFEKNSGF